MQVIEAVKAVLGGDCWIHPRVNRIARRISSSPSGLTDCEFEALVYISLGLTDRAIAMRLCITEKAVQARLRCLYRKLDIPLKGLADVDEYNHRCRAMNIAIKRGLINRIKLEEWESKLSS